MNRLQSGTRHWYMIPAELILFCQPAQLRLIARFEDGIEQRGRFRSQLAQEVGGVRDRPGGIVQQRHRPQGPAKKLAGQRITAQAR